MKLKVICVFFSILFLAVSFHGAWAGLRPIYEDKDVVISLKKAKKVATQHPYNFADNQISSILKQIRATRKKSMFSRKKVTISVFTNSEIKKITPPLIKAFQEAKANQWIRLILISKENYSSILREKFLTECILYWNDQGLNIRFKKILEDVDNDDDYGLTPVKAGDVDFQTISRGVRIIANRNQADSDFYQYKILPSSKYYQQIVFPPLPKETLFQSIGIELGRYSTGQ